MWSHAQREAKRVILAVLSSVDFATTHDSNTFGKPHIREGWGEEMQRTFQLFHEYPQYCEIYI
jgi:hypothetical protein